MAGSERRVRDLMTSQVLSMDRNEKLVTADDVMKLGRIRHLPVVDEDGKLAGIVSQTDLFRGAVLRSLGYGERAERRMLEGLAVKDAMTSNVITIGPDATAREAGALMLEHKIGAVVVVDGERIAGILTESDFVKAFCGGEVG